MHILTHAGAARPLATIFLAHNSTAKFLDKLTAARGLRRFARADHSPSNKPPQPASAHRRARVFGGLLLSLSVMGCAHNVIPLFGAEPYKADSQTSMVLNQTELNAVIQSSDLTSAEQELQSLAPPAQMTRRNDLIAEKIYLIDQAYYDYETRLTHDDQFLNSVGSLATFATNAVATALPAGETTKALNAVATGINGGMSIYDQKVLMSLTMQALQHQMRTDRDTQAALLYSKLSCEYAYYPLGLALSDLENYARVGTLSSAILGLSKTTTDAQTAAKTVKNAAAKGSGAGGADVAQQLVATAHKITETSSACPLAPPGKA
jgi:hypothetical protein